MALLDTYAQPQLTSSSTKKQLALGTQVRDDSGNIYEYVKISASSATAASVGRWFFKTATAGEVSDDLNGSGVLANRPAGMAIGTIAKSSYGFIMVDGVATAALKLVSTGLDITAGDFLVMGDPSQDGTTKAMTNGTATTQATLGVCKTTVTGLATTMACYVKING